MPRPEAAAVPLILLWFVACNDTYSFTLEVVHPSGASGAVVLFDGVSAPGDVYQRVFDSYDDATGQPPLIVEVIRGDVLLDTRAVSFDVCRVTCEMLNGDDCGLSELIESQLLMVARVDGQLSEPEGTCRDGRSTFVFTP